MKKRLGLSLELKSLAFNIQFRYFCFRCQHIISTFDFCRIWTRQIIVVLPTGLLTPKMPAFPRILKILCAGNFPSASHWSTCGLISWSMIYSRNTTVIVGVCACVIKYIYIFYILSMEPDVFWVTYTHKEFKTCLWTGITPVEKMFVCVFHPNILRTVSCS